MRIGYARVSTDDQTLDLQRDALKRAKCRQIYEEHASGKNTARPQLEASLKSLRDGDTLIVWRLDRLGRSLGDLIRLTHDLQARGVGFASLTEQIDTRSPSGQLVFHVFGALAEFERNLIRERTLAGLKAARARGPQWWPAEEAQSQGTEDNSHSTALERSARAGYRRAVRRESIYPIP